MKAILVINVNGEKLHEKEIELKDNDHAYENSPIARMTLLEKRTGILSVAWPYMGPAGDT
jgi:hypothetical protein